MLKHYRYSKILHWLTLLCFFLPFFYTGCQENGKAKDEQQPDTTIVGDTMVAIREKAIDTTDSSKTVNWESKAVVSDSLRSSANTQSSVPETYDSKEERTLSLQLTDSFTFLKPLLMPDKDIYTGIGIVINTFPLFLFIMIFISFLLLIISLLVKFIDRNARKAIVLIEALGLASMGFSYPFSYGAFSLDSERLWGYWICLVIFITMVVYDSILIRFKKESESVNSEE